MTRMGRIAPRDLGKFERKLKRKLPRILRELQQKSARQAVLILKEEVLRIKPYAPVTTRKYLNGWHVARLPYLGIVISNRQGYAAYIEGGRRAGARMPPIGAIQKWVKRKFGVGGKRGKGIAWAVAKKIQLRGIKKKPVVRRSTPKIRRMYTKNLKTANRRWFQ